MTGMTPSPAMPVVEAHGTLGIEAWSDAFSIAVGFVSLVIILFLKRRQDRGIDRAARPFVFGIIIMMAALFYERLISPLIPFPPVDLYHVLMAVAMAFFTLSAWRFAPSREDLIREIEARKRTEDELKKSELKFRTLAEHAPVGIYLLDSSGRTTYVNPRAAELAGVTVEEAVGHGWAKYLHPEDRERVFAELEEIARKGALHTSEFRFALPDGERSVLTSTAPIIEQGRHSAFIGIVMDVTEFKKTAKELALRAAEAERLVQSMVGRELKMSELKEEIRRLRKKLGE